MCAQNPWICPAIPAVVAGQNNSTRQAVPQEFAGVAAEAVMTGRDHTARLLSGVHRESKSTHSWCPMISWVARESNQTKHVEENITG